MMNLENKIDNKIALLLDDNLMTASRVQKQLEQGGFRVRGARALASSDEGSDGELPQLILINLGSRSLNGVGLISESRARFPAARVFGYCGHREIEIRRAAKAAGIEKILTNEQALGELGAYL